jgi:hypothetical protein
VTVKGSAMQSGALGTRTEIQKLILKHGTTHHQQQIANINVYLVLAFTSALAEISS